MRVQLIKSISLDDVVVPAGTCEVVIKDKKLKQMIAGKIVIKVVDSQVFKFDVDTDTLSFKIEKGMTIGAIKSLLNSLSS